MPGKPVWLTEWGWDAHLPGEPCIGIGCVSQHAQAVYAVRGLMILARKGVAQTHWWVATWQPLVRGGVGWFTLPQAGVPLMAVEARGAAAAQSSHREPQLCQLVHSLVAAGSSMPTETNAMPRYSAAAACVAATAPASPFSPCTAPWLASCRSVPACLHVLAARHSQAIV